jgi:Na+/phosphate symporter
VDLLGEGVISGLVGEVVERAAEVVVVGEIVEWVLETIEAVLVDDDEEEEEEEEEEEDLDDEDEEEGHPLG